MNYRPTAYFTSSYSEFTIRQKPTFGVMICLSNYTDYGVQIQDGIFTLVDENV